MEMILTLVSGIGWCIVYEECIRLAIKDKACVMPFWALALNITWEGIYSITELSTGSLGVQSIVNLIWFILDIIILGTYIKYGKNEWKEKFTNLTIKMFYAWIGIGITAMFAVQMAFVFEFGMEGHLSAQYSAFIQNLIMSVSFIGMLYNRKNASGQSILLAVAKWIGTLAPTVTMGIMSSNYVVLVCGLLCSIYDIIYIILLSKMKKISSI